MPEINASGSVDVEIHSEPAELEDGHNRTFSLAERLSLSPPHRLRETLGCHERSCTNSSSTTGTNIALVSAEKAHHGNPPYHTFAPMSSIMASSAAMLAGVPQYSDGASSDFVYMDHTTALVLEMHIPGATLQGIHKTDHGSLAEFLLKLHGELVSAAKVDERRIGILAIHERYQRVNAAPGTVGGKLTDAPKRLGGEVLVKFEVGAPLPVGGGAEPGEVMETLRNELSNPTSSLRRGPLGELLKDAAISLSLSPGLASIPLSKRKAVARMSAMALPIGISAAFTGILIWLAAW